MNWVLRMEWLLLFSSSSLQLRCLVCCTQFCGQFEQSNLHPSDSSTGFGSWSYQFWEQLKPNFWQKLQWTHLPTWSCLQPLYSFWASFLNSVTMWLMVFSVLQTFYIMRIYPLRQFSFLYYCFLTSDPGQLFMRPSVSFIKTPFLSQSFLVALSNCPCGGFVW